LVLAALAVGAAAQGTAVGAGMQGGVQQETGKPVSFEVISVKPSHSDSTRESMGMNRDGFTATNVQLHDLLLQAFELQERDELVGEPKWTTSDRWDIDARVGEAELDAVARMSFRERLGMFQEIMAERFGLKVRHETRELPVYALVVAKGGPKLKPSPRRPEDPDGIPGDPGVWNSDRGQETGRGTMTVFLAEGLSADIGRKVVDRTGLTGRYDFNLKWTPDDSAAAMAGSVAAGTAQGPSLFTAVEEQLGLKLEPVKAAVDVVVIDHLERPAGN
jgi:uncharacterized protein (TIGR03435 family)